MKIIGLAGCAGSGKDTVADLLLKQHGGYRRAFADPIREAAKAVFGLTDAQMQDRDKKEVEVPYWGRSPREILQLLGTESVRDVFGADTWVKSAELKLAAVLAADAMETRGSELLVYTDVRFPQEAGFIHSKGGVVVEVHRPGFGPVNEHASDQGLPKICIDFDLMNRGDLSVLEACVLDLSELWLSVAEHMCDVERVA